MLKNLITKIRKASNKQIEAQLLALSATNTPSSQSAMSVELSDQLTYGSSVVGYTDLYSQEHLYRTILNVIPKQDSIIDFGCGRGDLYGHLRQEERNTKDYLGIDFNPVLSLVGKTKYPDINIKQQSWNTLEESDKRDWAVAISSFDVAYTAEQELDRYAYISSTIDTMLNFAKKGIVLSFLKHDDLVESNILTYDLNRILNSHIQANYLFIVDACTIPNTYKLFILKPYEY
jgi:ubiquinone/menaquinone biosynthesis C-methylase UbiE